jgi:hypothetical protein
MNILYKKEFLVELFIMLLFHIITPFLSVIFYLSYIIFSRTLKKEKFIVLFILLASFLSLINSTKTPESDLLAYQELYLSSVDKNFIEYFHYIKDVNYLKEPIFPILNFLISLFIGDKFNLYLYLLSFSIYYIQFKAIHIYYEKVNNNGLHIIFSVVLLAFFNEYFSLTMHLLRQTLALSILIYCIIDKFVNNKNHLLLLCIAIMIHTTSFMFALPLCIKYIYGRLSLKSFLKTALIISLVLLSYRGVSSVLSNFFAFSETLSYGFKRLNVDSLNTLSTHANSLSYLLSIVLCLLVLMRYFNEKTKREDVLISNYYFIIVSIFWVASNNFSLLQERILVMIYSLIPYILPQILYKNDAKYSFFKISFSLLFIFRFFYIFESSVWSYLSLERIFTNNYFSILVY